MLIEGDSLHKLKELSDNSVDSIVTDPPYGIRFMGKSWDGADIEKMMKTKMRKETVRPDGIKRHDGRAFAAGTYDLTPDGMKSFELWTQTWASEAFRVLKPGGHLLSFASCRTYHRMACGIEAAGFEIRDQMQWIFGSGFPKSHNLKDEWRGWGTALKPANEPICVARKPLSESTVAKNVLRWGTGGLNIDGSRVALNGDYKSKSNGRPSLTGLPDNYNPIEANKPDTQGRWPANIILDESSAQLLDEQTGELKGPWGKESVGKKDNAIFGNAKSSNIGKNYSGETGGASRFFYVAKASKRERGEGNNHPTVKPIKLMEYLIKLVTPPQGTVLDPFMGSGTTGVAAKKLGFNFIGIELNEEYLEIAKKRMESINELV